jgi:hypothetical protein
MRSGLKKKRDKIRERVVLRERDNIIYVDFVLLSLERAVSDWYDKYYQQDRHQLSKKAHLFYINSFYDINKFKDHTNLDKARDDYLKEVDDYVQMRRDD